MDEKEIEFRQIRKMRRRVEEFLRQADPEFLILVANICKIQVPEKLIKKYIKKQ